MFSMYELRWEKTLSSADGSGGTTTGSVIAVDSPDRAESTERGDEAMTMTAEGSERGDEARLLEASDSANAADAADEGE